MSQLPSTPHAFAPGALVSMATLVFSLGACGGATEGTWESGDERGLEPRTRARDFSNAPPSFDATPDLSAPPSSSAPNSSDPANPKPDDEITRLGGCDPRPVWVSRWENPDDLETPPAWLSPSVNSEQIFWAQIETAAFSRLLLLPTGAEVPIPNGANRSDVPWPLLLGHHSVSTRLVAQVFSQSFDLHDSFEGLAETGGLAVTPDGRRLAQAACDEGSGDLMLWDVEGAGPPTRRKGPMASACLTSFTLNETIAALGDRNGLWQMALDSGDLGERWSTPGPVGRIDLSRDARRISAAYVNGNLIDLEAGSFPASCDVIDSVRMSLVARIAVSGSLTNVRRSPPGSLSIPTALGPNGDKLAFFDAERQLRLRSGDGLDEEHLLEAAPPQTERDPTAELPMVVAFSPDGRFLSFVRGRSLTTFACLE